MDIKVENIMEHIVLNEIEDLMEKAGVCACEKCQMDVAALALNKLKPKYIVSVTGFILENYNMNKLQGKVDIYKEIFDAIKIVSAKPMHDEFLSTQEIK